MKRNCVNCAAYWQDGDGYSDWTWMDTYGKCSLNLNNGTPSSNSKEEATWGEFANKCKEYDPTTGDPPCVSPEGELQGDLSRCGKFIRLIAR